MYDIKCYSETAIFDDVDSMKREQCLSRLTMLAHGIEKGFALRVTKKPFFLGKLPLFLELIKRARAYNDCLDDERYLMAVSAAKKYLSFHSEVAEVEAFRGEIESIISSVKIEQLVSMTKAASMDERAVSSGRYKEFVKQRSSVRVFSKRAVASEVINRAIELATYTPSVCNRQPWRVKVLNTREDITKVLSYQNGNSGFSTEMQTLLVVGCDQSCFVGSIERN